MKNVLLVSIAFPPKNDPECLQTARYFKYMVRAGIPMRVVTSPVPTLFMPYDKDLEKYVFPHISKIEIPITESKLTNFVLRKVWRRGIQYPDSKFSFHWKWHRVIKAMEVKPEIIYSRSNPLSSGLMAYKLQQHYGVPWVMHLSDPWVGSPMIRYSEKEYAYNALWENKCFHAASKVSFTTDKTLSFYKEKYPAIADKFFICPNVFDPEDASDMPMDFSGKMKIVYTGGLAGERTAGFFLEACRQAWKVNHEFEQAEIIFAGPIDRKNKKIIEESALPFVKHVGQLSYGEAKKLQQQAHILLTIDQPLEERGKSMFFPSKILDYFLIRRKILALTNRNSTTEEILAPFNSAIAYYDEIDPLKDFLLRSMKAFREKDHSFFVSSQLPLNFDVQKNVSKLISIFDSL